MNIAAFIALILYGTCDRLVSRFYVFFCYDDLIKAIVRQFYSVGCYAGKVYVIEWKR